MNPPDHTAYRDLVRPWLKPSDIRVLSLILARLEIRIFFEQLIPRIAEKEIVCDVECVTASFSHGLKHINIRYGLTD